MVTSKLVPLAPRSEEELDEWKKKMRIKLEIITLKFPETGAKKRLRRNERGK